MPYLPHGIPHDIVSNGGTNFTMAKYGNTFMLMRSAGLLCCSSRKHLFYTTVPGSAWASVSAGRANLREELSYEVHRVL